MKSALKRKAIDLRKQGLSYSEILRSVPVAKSTLSLWLRSVNLSQEQKQQLSDKKIASAQRGGKVRKERRIAATQKIVQSAISEIKDITNRELWLMGVTLYWAEGAKSKAYNPSQGVIFSNSDPNIVRLFLKWIKDCLHIPHEQIAFEIYVHESQSNQIELLKEYWSEKTGFSVVKFSKIYFKKHTLSSNRKNAGKNYHGILRVRLRKSTNLNRRITGWIEGIYQQCGVV